MALILATSALPAASISATRVLHRASSSSAAHHQGHRALVPRRPGSIMMFSPRGGPLVFTKHVAPVPPNRYLKQALPAARD